MGNEYKLEFMGDAVSIDALEIMLKGTPDYAGRVNYPGGEVIEFRTPERSIGIPDVYVALNRDAIFVCQNGDYYTAAHVLGVLVMEFVSESENEHVEVSAG